MRLDLHLDTEFFHTPRHGGLCRRDCRGASRNLADPRQLLPTLAETPVL
jgi:hypothetical protein